MENINQYAGKQIRMYRKAMGMTLQDLADAIHKSRSSVSKYETGEITLDLQTLYEISRILAVPMNRFTDFPVGSEFHAPALTNLSGKSPFFRARELHFYYYDGRYKRLKTGLIRIHEKPNHPGQYEASLSLSSISPTGRSSEIFYSGSVIYSDMLIRFSFVNQYNSLEEDLLYIFNPLDIRDSTYGLLSGISSADFMPCAFKCLVSLNPQDPTPELQQELLFTRKELDRWKKMNMLLLDNMLS